MYICVYKYIHIYILCIYIYFSTFLVSLTVCSKRSKCLEDLQQSHVIMWLPGLEYLDLNQINAIL